MSQPTNQTTPAMSLPPGGATRFFIGATDGLRSATWRVWTSKNNLDVYMSARTLASTWKVSLHESGSWQHGLVSDEKAAELLPAGRSRHFDIWPRPWELGPGLTRACSVVIPDAELHAWPKGQSETGPVVRVPHPEPGHAAMIEIILVEATSPVSGINFNEPIVDIAALARANGSAVRVIARHVPWSDANQTTLEEDKLTALRRVPTVYGNGGDASFSRLLLVAVAPDESRRFFDCAADDQP